MLCTWAILLRCASVLWNGQNCFICSVYGNSVFKVKIVCITRYISIILMADINYVASQILSDFKREE